MDSGRIELVKAITAYQTCERKLIEQPHFWQLLCELAGMLSSLERTGPEACEPPIDSEEYLEILSRVVRLLSNLSDVLEQSLHRLKPSDC